MSCTRAIGFMILGGTVQAGVGALAGYSGARILDDCGYEGYNSLEVTRDGAVGNAIIGAGLGFLSGCFKASEENQHSFKAALGGTVVSAGLATVGGILGRTILNTMTEMPLDKIAAAMATGSGAVAAGGVALALFIGCCACVCVTASAVTAKESDYQRMINSA